MKKPEKIFREFLKESERKLDNSAINRIVGETRKAVLTEAEVDAGRKFYDWVLKNIGERYRIIGGKTWIFQTSIGKVLIPKELAERRLWLNKHCWDSYKKV